jgi:Ca-activated chloride channel family protein
VHALGLASHYVAEVLEALTKPSGNAFEHVDGPEGLNEALGGLVSHLFGQVATEAAVRVQPRGLTSLTCRHAYPARLDQEALEVSLGDLTRGYPRRVLFSGVVGPGAWDVVVHASFLHRGDPTHLAVPVERVEPGSPRGTLSLGIGHELELVSCETAAWLSMARKDLERAETQLEEAERHLRAIVALAPEGVPVRRHLERLGDLRLAVERGESDLPLLPMLMRRAQSARAGTHVSQVIPLEAYRRR